MSAPILTERFLGGFAYFLEAGKTVDGSAISATYKPDATPATNWTDGYLGTIISLSLDSDTEDRSFMAPSPSGPWEKKPRKVVLADYLNLKTREMGEQLLRLQFGLTDAIVEGTAQTPFNKSDRRIEGWLKLHARHEDGQDMAIVDLWCSMELTGGIKADGKVTEPEFRLTVIKAVDGTAVAGNSIVFPATV